VVRQHRRFELLNVMLDGQPVGNATIDVWEDDASVPRWAARIMMKTAHGSTAGTLTGTTREGVRMKGGFTIGVGSVGPKGGSVIVDLHGDTPLEEDTDTPDPAA
jgi:hypothetical protein